MSVLVAIAAVTLRSLVSRRRTVLLLLLAALPVVVALIARLSGVTSHEAAVFDTLVVRTVLPIVALVFGTAALGSELEDGTAVYVLAKPIPRWQIVVAKAAVAAALSALIVGGSTILTGLVLAGGAGLPLTIAFTVATAVGSLVYVVAFVAASVVTARALILGLVYVIIWEGVLAGLLEGTRMFSIREATLGIAGALAPEGLVEGGLEPGQAVLLVALVVLGGTLLATTRLARFELRAAD